MGGNCFPGKTRRYNRDEYIALEEHLSDGLFAGHIDSLSWLTSNGRKL